MPNLRDHLAFSAEQPKQVYQQIREHVRTMIVQGKLAPGVKLPSTQQLAKKWSVPAATVQTALAHLVKEGLLVRIRKRGTFVLDRNRRLERIGAYYDTSVWRNDGGSFKQAVHLEMLRLCQSKNIKLEAFFDARKPSQRTTPLPEVVAALEVRQIQALIATDVAASEAAWIDKLRVPTAIFVEAEHPAKVDLDFDQFVRLGIEKLKSSGCSSVGILSLRGPWKPSTGTGKSGKDQGVAFTDVFAEICEKYGVETSARWIKTADAFVEGKAQQDFGYEQFLQLWEGADHPDGLLVYPNSCAIGAITAILEKRIEVPEDLQLVLHKHRELDYLCPLEVSFLCSSVADVAEALLQQIMDQFEGKSRPQVIVPFSFEPAASLKVGRKKRVL